MIENIDFYFNEDGNMVFTEKFHLAKGTCCGNGCKHCPYSFILVPEPKRSKLLWLKKMKKINTKNISLILKEEMPALKGKKKDYSFFQDVYDVVRQIPRGRATSYGAIAHFIGIKSSARMVGWAMNGCHIVKPAIPAHRVVNRNGMLSGRHHFAKPTLMEELLAKENINVINNTIVDFKNIFWDPSLELSL